MRNAAGEEYGADRLIETLSRCHGMKPEAVMDTLMASVRTFVGGAPQADDITTLVVRFVGTPA